MNVQRDAVICLNCPNLLVSFHLLSNSWTVIGLGGHVQLINTALFNMKEITTPKLGKQ